MRIPQIAVGLFVGIMAVIAVFKYPDWMKNGVKERNAFVVAKITPEGLISKCGQPLSDKQKYASKQHTDSYRSIEYQGSFSRVRLDFYKDKDTAWFLTGTKVGPELAGAWDKNGASRMIIELPCMGKKD